MVLHGARCSVGGASVEADGIYNLPILKATLLRLFPRVHLRERWGGRPGLPPPGGRGHRRALETQAFEGQTDGGYDEPYDEQGYGEEG